MMGLPEPAELNPVMASKGLNRVSASKSMNELRLSSFLT